MDIYNTWIEALNNYHPTAKYLRTDEGFCCLGVLCDIVKSGQWIRGDGDDNYIYNINNSNHTDMIPADIKNKINFKDTYGTFRISDLSQALQNQLFECNDIRDPKNQEQYDIISLADINDILYQNNINPFPIIQKILIERPPSLFN